MNRIPVAVLAATGSVGQRFVQLLDQHPWFELAYVTASDRSVGEVYGETCHWVLPEPMPESVRKKVVLPTEPGQFSTLLVFSALPAAIARDVEPKFAQAGFTVCSNASAFRTAEDVPILLPEVNPEHLQILPLQRQNRGWRGAIVTNPNCTSTGMSVVLKAIQNSFGLKRVLAFSMQALSGAGYPGVPSLDILDNVIPFIEGEEEKVEWEPRKILGEFKGNAIVMADFGLSAHTNRVAVSDGHLVCLSIETVQKTGLDEITRVLNDYAAPEISRRLPSSPNPVIVQRKEKDRPQPKLDRMTGNGMSTVIGRLRPDPVLDFKLVVSSHNTIRGAAGGSIYNAELLYQQGWLENSI